MTPADYAIVLHVGTRIVTLNAALRDRTPAVAYDMTGMDRQAVAAGVAERARDAHARFVFSEERERLR